MIIIIFGLGLIFGSFVSALVWRTHINTKNEGKPTSKKYSILSGRSVCPKCHHILQPVDLFPVLSWLMSKGKCRYCKQPITWQYPAIELLTGVAFLLSYVYWPRELVGFDNWLLFALWLLSVVGFMSLAVYDLRWMLLPDKLMQPLILISLAASVLMVIMDGVTTFRSIVWGIVIGFGFFYILFQISNGRWIGGGDVKFGLVMGLWLGAGKTMVALMGAFYGAALFILPLMLLGVASRKSQIPFGPFLIAATFAGWLFGQELVDWYQQQFLAGLV